ncbi:MAG: hypothetical protein JST75_09980 [Bacteroidetes bacterium]|nr:hypothetical protein [Bacteroidota bacterium]
MKEYLLLIRTEGDPWDVLSPDQQQKHVEKAATYIGNLVKDGKLKGAQPLEPEGKIISNTKGTWKDGPFNESKEVIAGYFIVLANDLEEAMNIARANPIYEDQLKVRIEVRPIKTVEGINR